MSVWLCIPSKRPPAEAEKCLKLWRERGYKIALMCDSGTEALAKTADRRLHGAYAGYAATTNALVREVLLFADLEAEWVVLGGDDIEPDANHSAEEIARQCSAHFGTNPGTRWASGNPGDWRTFGVMQPTGDRWGDTPYSRAQFGEDFGAYADRVCGSPWIGREFALRINQGRGPLWPEYFHMYEDEELFHVAQKYGVLWQRRDLIHLHNHWGRARGRAEDMPEFLKRANSPEEWRKAKELFDRRKAGGFPGSEPL